MSDTSKVGCRGDCSVSGAQKTIFYEYMSESNPGLNKYYCKECYDYSNEKITCSNCGKEFAREDMAKHKLDMHTD